ncbi:hypothetical protein [Candidatus Harpocratesius sp.]
MSECNQCGVTIEDENARFCRACGAEIRPAEVIFASSLDEDASTIQKMVNNLKNTYYEIYYKINALFFEKTSNLFHKRMYLENNLKILKKADFDDPSERLDEINDNLKLVAQNIRKETENLQTNFLNASRLYDEGEFIPAKIAFHDLHNTTQKLGFYSWLNEIIRNQHQIQDNIKCLHALERILVPAETPDIAPEELKSQLSYLYYKTLQLENFIKNRNESVKNPLKIHKTVIDQLDRQKTHLISQIESNFKKLPEFNFGNKLNYFFKTTIQNIKITLQLIKFDRLLKIGQDYSNLPRALKSLQDAQKLSENPDILIYSDKKLEMELIITQIMNMIADFTKEKDQAVNQALEMAFDFEFDKAIQILNEKEQYLTQYSMEGLIKELQIQQNICKFNKEINIELEQINSVYENGDYLEAFQLMETTKKKLDEIDENLEILENIQTKIKDYESKILKSRNEGESLLNQELDKIWKFLAEDLDFEKARNAINDQLTIVNKQKYHSTQKRIEDLLENLELNYEAYKDYNEIVNLHQQKQLKIAQEKLSNLKKKIEKNANNYINKLQQLISSLEKELNISIEEEAKIIQQDINKAQSLLVNQLEFFQATEILSNCKNKAMNAGLEKFLKIIDDLAQRIVDNQRIQTEQVSYESKIQEGFLQQAKDGLTSLLQTVTHNQEKYEPLLIKQLQKVIEKLDKKIKEEENEIETKIDEFHEKMDESLDFTPAETLLNEIDRQIQTSGLEKFNKVLSELRQKIEHNRSKLAEYEELQKVFEEGDIHQAEHQAKNLLNSIEKELKKSPRFYSVALKDAVSLLYSEIQTALKDGKEKLTADFQEVQKRVHTALDFIEILQLLKNYQIRAQRLGEDVLKNQIVVLENQVLQNSEIIEKHNQLAQKYSKMEDFIVTLREIKNLVNQVKDNIAIFDQIKIVVQSLQDRVESDNEKREEQIRNSLQNIVETELNALDFTKAAESLMKLKETAQSLAINQFNAEINQYLLMCQSHKNFKIRIDNALVKEKAGQIIEARNVLEDIKSDLDHHDSPVLDALHNYLNENYERINRLISNEIEKITKDVKGRLFKLIEGKQGEIAYFVLEEHLDRARYLEASDLVKEINDLMKLCTLQFDPTDKKYRKKKKKREKIDLESQIEQALEKTTMIATPEQSQVVESKKAGIQTILVKYDFEAQEKTPHFNTTKELREYKRKQRILKQARIIKPPKITENLNNQVRSSVTRARLQAFDRQSNRPLKRAENKKCLSCGYIQKQTHNVFCEFCGNPL